MVTKWLNNERNIFVLALSEVKNNFNKFNKVVFYWELRIAILYWLINYQICVIYAARLK